MWDWEESHPASLLYYSWGVRFKNFNENVGRVLTSVPRDDNLRLRPTINVYFT